MPRLQIHGSSEDEEHERVGTTTPFSADTNSFSTTPGATRIETKGTEMGNITENDGFGEDKKALRREIKKWWEGVADHMDKLVRPHTHPSPLLSHLGCLGVSLVISV